jgi:hypothetical protein
MSATKQRDAVARQAKTDLSAALHSARNIADPWFRAQALAHVLRYSEVQSQWIADQAAAAAEECSDAYKQCAARAWEIAALAERSDCKAAVARLTSVLSKIGTVVPPSSRSEALSLLLHAAARIGPGAAQEVAEIIVSISNNDSHWRCQRATVGAIGVVQRLSSDVALALSEKVSDVKLRSKCDKIRAEGGTSPRAFFW